MVTDISHQLKTPLAPIKSTFEIMQKQRIFRKMNEENLRLLWDFKLQRLEKLILSLVNISRLESGMIDIKAYGRQFV